MEESRKKIKRVLRKTVFFIVALGLLSIPLFSYPVSLGILVGGGIALLSFGLLAKSVEIWIARQQGTSTSPWVFLLVLKYPLLLAGIGFMILKTPLSVGALMIGFLSLVVAIVWEGLHARV